MTNPLPEFDVELYVDQMQAMHGLQLDPAWRPGIIENLNRARQIATAFLTFSLPDDVEQAPVFTP